MASDNNSVSNNTTDNNLSSNKLSLIELYNAVNHPNYHDTVKFDQNNNQVEIQVFNKNVAPLIKSHYESADFEVIKKYLDQNLVTEIKTLTKPYGTFAPAASFQDPEKGLETNYNAIWVRDSLWVYLATKNIKLLTTLLDYYVTQKDRISKILQDDDLLKQIKQDNMEADMLVPHIRFDANSPEFKDVQDGDHDQYWTHKQNDALGLLIDLTLRTYKLEDLPENYLEIIQLLVQYLIRIEFWDFEDSGAWEEITRVNASSVGLVVSALENVVSQKGANKYFDLISIDKAIVKGYERIRKNLKLGGESPDYPENSPKYRTADAALLNLIYPAKLKALTIDEKVKVLKIVGTLQGKFGIRRYQNDNYQAGNFWYHDIKTDADEKSIQKREQNFIAGTEAEWFFDSWVSLCFAKLGLKKESFLHLSRALGQISGSNQFLADGSNAPENCLPESYNFIVNGENLLFARAVASPIIPLNWSKSTLTLAIENFLTQL